MIELPTQRWCPQWVHSEHKQVGATVCFGPEQPIGVPAIAS